MKTKILKANVAGLLTSAFPINTKFYFQPGKDGAKAKLAIYINIAYNVKQLFISWRQSNVYNPDLDNICLHQSTLIQQIHQTPIKYIKKTLVKNWNEEILEETLLKVIINGNAWEFKECIKPKWLATMKS